MTGIDHNREAFERHYRATCYRPREAYFQAINRTRLELLMALPRELRALDVGCGSGEFLLPLVERGQSAAGIDYSRPILDELRSAARSRGIDAASLDVHAGDARALPFGDEAFDAVFSFATLYAIPETELAIAQIARVLRPGGIALLELGNVRSLNAVEATRVGTGLRAAHQTPAVMRSLLARADLVVQEQRAFQLFPCWGGGTERARSLLNPRIGEALAERAADGRMLDEVLSSSPWMRPFAFRQLWVVRKGGVAPPLPRVPALPAEPQHRRERRRLAAEALASGDVEGALEQLLACVREAPEDPRAALDLAALYDGDAEQRLVRRWRRVLTRTGMLPFEGAPRTAAPATAPRSPRVSIVLPTFDAGDQLAEAVQSVFAQTFGDFELIVVDDGSRDDTTRRLMGLRDPRVTVVRQANQKLPTALNRGFALARGEYRTWISADNVCAPTMLTELVAALDAAPTAQLAVAGFERIGARGEHRSFVTGQDLRYACFLLQNPGVAAFLYRSSTAQRIGDYDAALLGAEDWDYWIRLLQHGPAVGVDAVLCGYREHRRSMTSTIPDRVVEASRAVVTKWRASHGGLPPVDLLGGDPAVWLWFGTRLLTSRFAPVELAIEALHRALQHDPHDGRALVQLTIALARGGRVREAATLAQHYAQAPDPGLRRLAERLRRAAAGQLVLTAIELPVLPVDELPTGAI